MILFVTGNNDAAKAIRTTLSEQGFVVRDTEPPVWARMRSYFHLTVEEKVQHCPAVDGVDSPLEAHVMNQLAECSPSGQVVLLRAGGNRNDRALRVIIPAKDEERAAAVTAVYRALRGVTKQ